MVERLKGNGTTDFGAPDVQPLVDADPAREADVERLRTILEACWKAFDSAVSKVGARELRRGPQGGGRDLEKIIRHIADAEAAYLSRIGGKVEFQGQPGSAEALAALRRAVLDRLGIAARNWPVERGPRGGVRWTPRYFVRRAAWHLLDHTWEIQDRTV